MSIELAASNGFCEAKMNKHIIRWGLRGKTVGGLIKELSSFEDRNLKVEISIDGGRVSKPISLVGKENGKCLLISVPLEE